MKIKINRKLKIPFLIMLVIAIIACLAVIYIFIINNHQIPDNTSGESKTVNYSPATKDQKQSGETQKESTKPTPDSNATSAFTVAITSSNITGELVQIRAIISGAISNTGTCQLILSKDGISVTKQSATNALPSSSTCQGFDVSRSELSAGTWSVNLSTTINNETATTTSEVILK